MIFFLYNTNLFDQFAQVNNSHFANPIPDYCSVSNVPVLQPFVNNVCEAETELLDCMDEYASSLPEKQAFLSDNATALAELKNNSDQMITNLTELTTKSTWEPVSTTICAINSGLCFAWASYLFWKYVQAKNRYENIMNAYGWKEWEENHPAIDMFLIKHMASQLDLSMEKMTLDEFTQELQKDAVKTRAKKIDSIYASIAFFQAGRAKALPKEVTERILWYSELPVIKDPGAFPKKLL